MVKLEIKSFSMDYEKHAGLSCTAPCSLYSVLLEHGIIDDPAKCEDISLFAKMPKSECVFTSKFEVTQHVLAMKSVILRFSGLDTVCRIELNGKELASTDSMHLVYNFEAKTKLKVGINELKLTFTPVEESIEMRKAYFSFGTECSPRFMDMGIFRKVELIAFNHKIITDVAVKQTHSDSAVKLDFKLKTYGYDEMSRAVATLTSPAGNSYFCGFVGGEGSITITDPNLWWPNGVGMQNLYKLHVNLYSDIEIEDTYEANIGLRTVSVKNENGNPRLLVNGTPVFVMGGEYMSEDIILPRLSESRTRELLEKAARSNFNSILIHGSGYYPENYFYSACDELGLLVFIELPIEDVITVDSPEVKEKLKREIVENMSAIDHHPSLSVIIGNERVNNLFSSEEEKNELAKEFSDSLGNNVFDSAGECNSYFTRVGHTSLPTYESITKFAAPKVRNIGSPFFECHGADKDTVSEMLLKSLDNYPYPNGMNELSYIMGLSSAELSRRDVDNVRRSKEKAFGILMQNMNDTWPAISPSAVDYYRAEKPLHYYERDFFAPVKICAVANGKRIKFTVTNDMRVDYVGVFSYQIMNNKNQAVFRDSFPIRARASSNLEVHNADVSSVVAGHENEYYILYSVSNKCNEPSKGILLFTNIKKFNLLKPNLKTEINGNGFEYTITVSSDVLTLGVELSFLGEEVYLDKNYFDITGAAPIRINLTSKRITTIEKLKRLLKVRTLYDLGTEE